MSRLPDDLYLGEDEPDDDTFECDECGWSGHIEESFEVPALHGTLLMCKRCADEVELYEC